MTLALRRPRRWPGRLIAVACAVGVFALGLPAPAPAEQVVYYHVDTVGSVRAVTNSAGAVIERHDYYAFGEECTTPPCAAPGPSGPLHFTGKARDVETGFDYFGARYYGSQIARFTTVDPLMTVGQNALDPQRWNRYAYGRNNPFKFVDPNGEDTFLVIYGGPYLNSSLQGQHGDVGRQFQIAADTYANRISKSPGYNPATDAIVTVEARSTQQFVDATNKQYASGKIATLAVFSHGFSQGIALGGEIGSSEQLATYDLREINTGTVRLIDKTNFTDNAMVDLFGCNCGNGIAAAIAAHLGGNRKAGGFTGPAEFKAVPGGLEMVPTYRKDKKEWFPK